MSPRLSRNQKELVSPVNVFSLVQKQTTQMVDGLAVKMRKNNYKERSASLSEGFVAFFLLGEDVNKIEQWMNVRRIWS